MVADQPAIETLDLCKAYVEGVLWRKKQVALKGVSLRVERGEIFGLLGGNGAGKTTFIKTLLGIIRKSSGEARLLGLPAGDRRGRRLVGYLPENLRVPRHLTGYTALEFYGNLSNVPTSIVRQRRGYLTDLKREGKTIFLNSHILQEVELICDRVAILDKGVLRRVANVAEITSGRRSLAADGGNGQPAAPPEALELHLDLAGNEAS